MHLVDLDPDHPGFADPTYRARRDAIARIADDHRGDGPAPIVEYTVEEHAVWRSVWAELGPVHRATAARELLAIEADFPLDRQAIPQLRSVSARLARTTGFGLQPVSGLVPARRFLGRLADGVFLSTQYVRHPSRPLYTPEPDVIHELVGHAAGLAHPELAALHRLFGAAARIADDAGLEALERVYWFTIEFGLCAEDGRPRAVGAGLLSSIGEARHALAHARHRPFDLEAMAATPYETRAMQAELFVAPSFAAMIEALRAWLSRQVDRGRWSVAVSG